MEGTQEQSVVEPVQEETGEHHQDIKKRIDEFFQRYLQTECELLEERSRLKAEGELCESNLPQMSQVDQALFQTIMSKREKQISEEIKTMTFDIDYGTFEFQKNFYKKFLLL